MFSKRKWAWCVQLILPDTWDSPSRASPHAITTLQAGGFVERDKDGFIRLTDVGREVAERTYEKHCFFTEMLIEAGVDQETAEADACRMEHAISEDSFQHLKVKRQE